MLTVHLENNLLFDATYKHWGGWLIIDFMTDRDDGGGVVVGGVGGGPCGWVFFPLPLP